MNWPVVDVALERSANLYCHEPQFKAINIIQFNVESGGLCDQSSHCLRRKILAAFSEKR